MFDWWEAETENNGFDGARNGLGDAAATETAPNQLTVARKSMVHHSRQDVTAYVAISRSVVSTSVPVMAFREVFHVQLSRLSRRKTNEERDDQ